MKINRAKAIRKYLKFYRLVFGIKAPFNVILDGNFIYEAIKHKIDVLDRVKRSLQGEEVRLFVTSSILAELKKVGPRAEQALEFATKFCHEIDDSKFLDFGEAAADRLSAMMKQTQDNFVKGTDDKDCTARYFVATQDKKLRKCLGGIPGTPLFYLNNVSFVMEPPSNASKNFNRDIEGQKVALNEKESAIVSQLMDKTKGKKRNAAGNVVGAGPEEKDSSEKVGGTDQRVKKKAKAANPLSTRPADVGSSKSRKKKAARFRGGG